MRRSSPPLVEAQGPGRAERNAWSSGALGSRGQESSFSNLPRLIKKRSWCFHYPDGVSSHIRQVGNLFLFLVSYYKN